MARTFELVNLNAQSCGKTLAQALAPYARLCAWQYTFEGCVAVDGELYRLKVLKPYDAAKIKRRVAVTREADSVQCQALQREFEALFASEWSLPADELCSKYVPEGSVIYVGHPKWHGDRLKELDPVTAYYLNAQWWANTYRFPPAARQWLDEYRWLFRADYDGVTYGEAPERKHLVTVVNLVMPDGAETQLDLRNQEEWRAV